MKTSKEGREAMEEDGILDVDTLPCPRCSRKHGYLFRTQWKKYPEDGGVLILGDDSSYLVQGFHTVQEPAARMKCTACKEEFPIPDLRSPKNPKQAFLKHHQQMKSRFHARLAIQEIP